MRDPGRRRRGAGGAVLTAFMVTAIVVAGITIGRSVGDGIEARVAPRPPDRNLARSEPVLPTPGDGFYWGSYRDGAPYDRALLEDLEDQAGSRPALVMWYQEWHGNQAFPLEEARWLSSRGVVPVISWEPWRPPVVFGDLVVTQPDYTLAKISGGSFDKYIRKYAVGARTYGGPVMLRPFHEMDGTWYPWGGHQNGNTPAEFIRAWRHVHDIFEAVGATNVTWVWSVNHESVPVTASNQIARYWPGARYVDWTGISGFNWGRASPLSVWKGIDAVIGERYLDLLAYGKPIALMETGAPEKGGDKSKWIASTYARLASAYPGIDAVIWYDRRDSTERDWRIDSTPAALAAFKRAVSGPAVFDADSAWLTTTPGSPRGGTTFSDSFDGKALDDRWVCTTTRGKKIVYAANGAQVIAKLPQGTSHSACLDDQVLADGSARLRMSWSTLGSGRTRNEAAVFLRATDARRHYSFLFSEGDGRAAVLTIRRTSSGRVTNLASVRMNFAIASNTQYEIEGRARTTATGIQLEMRAWKAGSAEPADWSLTVLDGGTYRLARGLSGFALTSDDGPLSASLDKFSAL